MTLFSVCIPFYGSSNFLKEALDSALNVFSSVDAEILVLLDEDATSDLRNYYEALGVIFIDGARSGLAANWNKCVKCARGEFIVILHSDDILKHNYYEVIEELQSRYPGADLWFVSADIIDNEGKKISTLIDFVKGLIRPFGNVFQLNGDDGLSRLLFGCFLYNSAICYRRTSLTSAPFNEELKMAVDLDFYGRLLMEGGQMAGSSVSALYYRRHNASESEGLRRNGERFLEETKVSIDLGNRAYEGKRWIKSKLMSRLRPTLRLHALLSWWVMRP